uniref:Ovule protein n=1 Tax=Mesocestoides corti TaxID=53468 RepID=A0A5K3EZB9_MESCO
PPCQFSTLSNQQFYLESLHITIGIHIRLLRIHVQFIAQIQTNQWKHLGSHNELLFSLVYCFIGNLEDTKPEQATITELNAPSIHQDVSSDVGQKHSHIDEVANSEE